ncbi:MAG: hypothetical protein GSR86_00735 [Desulfurococcales archaeon]|nr:hypothetical protein [Desulfurococcales archaeon]
MGFGGVRRLAGVWIAGVGFILSPLSWWNDLFVNVPLALVISKVLSMLIDVSVSRLFVVSYWVTNVVGLLLLAVGGGLASGRRPGAREVCVGLVMSVVYTVLAVALLGVISG